MKTLVLFFAALALAFGALAATESRTGVWTAEVDSGLLHVTLLDGHDSHESKGRWGNVMSFSMPLARFEGLAEAETVTFALHASAGALEFNGHFSNGEGAGHFRFAPSDSFVREMSQLGYSDFPDRKLLVLAVHDLTPETIRQLRALGYEPTRREVDEIAIFGVTPALIRDYDSLGLSHPSLRELINLRVGNVDGTYVKAMQELGYRDLSAHDLAEMAILGVSPAYVRDLQAAGLSNLTSRELRDLRVGNVTAKSIGAFRDAGYANLSAKELSEFGIQNVTSTYITELRKLGYGDIPPHQLIELRIFNVTPEYIRQMNSIGVKELRKMVELKSTGAADILLKKR